MTPRTISRFAWLTLGWNVLVILWGAWVRASGSGAGCGSHWPLCNGEVVPTDPAIETLIEVTHRATSGIALILVVALLIVVCREFPRGAVARRGAWWSLVFILAEALLGAALVIFGLVVDDASPARAWVVGFHLCNTFLLLGALTLTALWTGGEPAPRWATAPALRGLALAAVGGLLVVGATGAISALGDTLFPVSSLAGGLAQDLDPDSHLLLRLRALHPLVAVAVALVLVQLASSVRRRPHPAAARRANWLTTLVFLQIIVGGLNVILLAPTWLQLAHLAIADGVWIALVATLSAGFAPAPDPG